MKKKSIVFNKVTKNYSTSKGKYGLLTDNLSGLWKKQNNGSQYFAALKNVSFTIYKGESVGLIGKNGAGKSTILKLISRISYPNKGKVAAFGKIGAFIELGAGLHPELTGRENIFLYGAILGMSRKEILEKFDQIVNFAEIQSFLDLPIKKYSSGMYSRLGFSTVAFCDPDVLLIDEVLAVGDLNFQKKCLEKMHSFAKKKTIVFVSHNVEAIKSICKRTIYLKNGSIIQDGPTSKVVSRYLKDTFGDV